MIKLIGLDFDGVVIRGSNEAYFDCYHQSIASVGVTLDPDVERERIVQGWGMGHVEQLEILLKEHLDLVPKAVETWNACLLDPAFKKHIKLVDGAKETIARLAKSHTVVIVSGTRRNDIKKLLDEHKIEGVTEIYSSYDVDPDKRKPHPFMLEMAMKNASATPEETILVGDMDNDVKMTLAAKAIPVIALTGFLNEAGARELGVKYIIPSISELGSLIKKM